MYEVKKCLIAGNYMNFSTIYTFKKKSSSCKHYSQKFVISSKLTYKSCFKHYDKRKIKFKFDFDFIIFLAPLCELVAKQEMSDFPDHQSASSRNNLIYYEKYGSIYIPGF